MGELAINWRMREVGEKRETAGGGSHLGYQCPWPWETATFSHLYLGTQGIPSSSLYFRMGAQSLHIHESDHGWKGQGCSQMANGNNY